MEVDRKHLYRSRISCWERNEDPLIPPVPSLPVIINPMLLKFGSGVDVVCKAFVAWSYWGCCVTVQGVVANYLCNTELSTHRNYSHLLCPSFWMGSPGCLWCSMWAPSCVWATGTVHQHGSGLSLSQGIKTGLWCFIPDEKEMLYGVTFVQICIFIAAS